MSKLSNKHKRKVRRDVDIEQGIVPPRRIIFKSKKIYDRKKYKNNRDITTNNDDV